jgi:hypothetical protein
MGKIDDYATGTAGLTDKLLASDGGTGVTKNLLVSDLIDGLTTYLETDISSAELLAIFTTPKTILAAPGAGMYYKYRAILEYDYGTAIYTTSGGGELYLSQGNADCYFPNNAIKQIFNTASEGTFYGFAAMNTALILTSQSNPTLGDGTCKLKLWYTIETFG